MMALSSHTDFPHGLSLAKITSDFTVSVTYSEDSSQENLLDHTDLQYDFQ